MTGDEQQKILKPDLLVIFVIGKILLDKGQYLFSLLKLIPETIHGVTVLQSYIRWFCLHVFLEDPLAILIIAQQLILLHYPSYSILDSLLLIAVQQLINIFLLGSRTQHLHFLQILLLLEDEFLQNLAIFGDKEVVNFAVKLVLNGAADSGERLAVAHLFSKEAFAKMDYYLFDPILQDFVLATHVKIVEELFLPLCDFVLFVDKVVHVLEVFINVEFFPEHGGILHRERRDCQAELVSQLVYDLYPVA